MIGLNGRASRLWIKWFTAASSGGAFFHMLLLRLVQFFQGLFLRLKLPSEKWRASFKVHGILHPFTRGIGSPRTLQGLRALLQLAWTHFGRLISAIENLLGRSVGYGAVIDRATAAA